MQARVLAHFKLKYNLNINVCRTKMKTIERFVKNNLFELSTATYTYLISISCSFTAYFTRVLKTEKQSFASRAIFSKFPVLLTVVAASKPQRFAFHRCTIINNILTWFNSRRSTRSDNPRNSNEPTQKEFKKKNPPEENPIIGNQLKKGRHRRINSDSNAAEFRGKWK